MKTAVLKFSFSVGMAAPILQWLAPPTLAGIAVSALIYLIVDSGCKS